MGVFEWVRFHRNPNKFVHAYRKTQRLHFISIFLHCSPQRRGNENIDFAFILFSISIYTYINVCESLPTNQSAHIPTIRCYTYETLLLYLSIYWIVCRWVEAIENKVYAYYVVLVWKRSLQLKLFLFSQWWKPVVVDLEITKWELLVTRRLINLNFVFSPFPFLPQSCFYISLLFFKF